MYKISELATKAGLSRSTLLYYEKLGLISGRRQANGYRYYSDTDAQRLALLKQLQAGGLSLKECQTCLDAQIDREQLLSRLNTLDEEIIQKQKARELLAAMLGLKSMREWHSAADKVAPLAHTQWLQQQGFSEKQALRLKWLSKDMNQHQLYMHEFGQIFSGLNRLGPGSKEDTLIALNTLPFSGSSSNNKQLLEVGCGKGVATQVLADASLFSITALDNDEDSLAALKQSLPQESYPQVSTVCASMTDMPFKPQQFDLIWAEGCAYIMGVEQALRSWKPLLKHQGYLVFSDLIWLTATPAEAVKAFWQQNYPDMDSLENRLKLIETTGFKIVDTFELSQQAWRNYLDPLIAKQHQLLGQDFGSNALEDLNKELEIHQKYLSQYGYQVFILKQS